MRGQEHSTVGEGVVTGIIGAIIVANWWRRHPRLAHSFDQGSARVGDSTPAASARAAPGGVTS
jgi:hypothetical protein